MVPRLTTAFSGPLLEIERCVLDAMPEIERWLRGQWQEHTPPFYGSVDLRNAGFKLAPVDMNLFPGGFNNLDATFLPLCVQAAVTADRPHLPRRQEVAADSRKPYAQRLLFAECGPDRGNPALDRS
jgi:glutamate--cysteine ligase